MIHLFDVALIVLSLLGTASILLWFAVLFHSARPWDLQPIGEELAPPSAPLAWPAVAILVPARNEAAALPRTLPALLGQEYPGAFQVLLIDDRSTDGTADAARKIGVECGAQERLTVIEGLPLPAGWAGKVWALEQGANTENSKLKIQDSRFLLLTDADILHARGSLRRLVAESCADALALNSRMARLRCVSPAEKLLIPPFVFFFNLLYPLRRVNDPGDPLAAAAGGCVLLSREALEEAGGFASIQGALIDDLNLARKIKRPGRAIRLALSREDVVSLRSYATLGAIWAMVRRTAFTELGHSWLRLAGALAALAMAFVVPPFLLVAGGVLSLLAWVEALPLPLVWTVMLACKGILAWALLAHLFRPAVTFFQLRAGWRWTLPLAGLLYGGMTLDSACQHLGGKGSGWRDRGEATL